MSFKIFCIRYRIYMRHKNAIGVLNKNNSCIHIWHRKVRLISLPLYSILHRFCASQCNWIEFPTRVSQEGVNPLSSDNTMKLYNLVLDACSLERDLPPFYISFTLFSRFCSLIIKLTLCSIQLNTRELIIKQIKTGKFL